MPIAAVVANSAESNAEPTPMRRLFHSPVWKSLMICNRAYHSPVNTGGNGHTLFSMNDRYAM